MDGFPSVRHEVQKDFEACIDRVVSAVRGAGVKTKANQEALNDEDTKTFSTQDC